MEYKKTIENKDISYYKNDIIGKGSFSVVYRGKYKNMIVAIKKIDLARLEQKSHKLVRTEIDIIKRLQNKPHKNIVQTIDILEDKEKEQIYIVMEYCSNGHLGNLLKKNKPHSESFTLHFMKQLIEAINHLYNNKIIHRDLKPRNLLLTNNYNDLKICDFGFSHIYKQNEMLTTFCGSPLYMAPELLNNKKYDYSAEVWSIGMIFYEILFGIHPFEKCSEINELIKVTKKIIIPPKLKIKYKLTNNCLNLLQKMLEEKIETRINILDIFDHLWLKKNDNLFLKLDEYDSDTEIYDMDNISIYSNNTMENSSIIFNFDD